MKNTWVVAVLLLTVCPLVAASRPAIPAEKAQHDRQFWRSIAAHRYAVPEGQPVLPLVQELSGYLGSTDPELRDDLAYSILTSWIADQDVLNASELIGLGEEWQGNLREGIGEAGTDSVFKRSFSALCLVALAERDRKKPFLGEDHFRALLTNALKYLRAERDLRGFDPVKGWIHATAHTADLLAELAGNPLLKKEDQATLFEAISTRLASANEVFSYGEQERLAAVAATIVMRKDFEPAVFQEWLAKLDASDQKVWKDVPPKLDLLKTFENDSYILRGLAVYLMVKEPAPAVVNARDAVLRALRNR